MHIHSDSLIVRLNILLSFFFVSISVLGTKGLACQDIKQQIALVCNDRWITTFFINLGFVNKCNDTDVNMVFKCKCESFFVALYKIITFYDSQKI